MKLTRIDVEKFRAIDESRVDLPAPITGIWGPNGCGKSVLLQAIVVAKSLARHGYGDSPPRGLNSEGLLLGDWDSVYFKGERSKGPLKIALFGEAGSAVVNFERSEDNVVLKAADPGLLDLVRYFPPRRTVTSRSRGLDDYSPDGLALSPDRAHAYLHWFLHEKLQEEQQTHRGTEFEEVNAWMSRFGFGALRDRRNPGEDVRVSGVFKDAVTGHETAIVDGGFGGNSILPIILEAFSFKDGVLLLEEPEISLHPAAQADLFDLFLDLVRKRGHQIIFTSHSEYLLRRLARQHREAPSPQIVGFLMGTKDSRGAHFQPGSLDGLVKELETGNVDLLMALHKRAESTEGHVHDGTPVSATPSSAPRSFSDGPIA